MTLQHPGSDLGSVWQQLKWAPMTDPGQVSKRLAEILVELDRLPPGPSPERFQLLVERDELRDQAGQFGADQLASRSTEELETELESLRQTRDSLVSSHTGFITAKGGSSAAPTSGAWVELSKKSLGAAGLDRFNQRISQIEDVLAERTPAEKGPQPT